VVQFIFEGNDQKNSHIYRVKHGGKPGGKKERGAAERLWRRSLTRNVFDVVAPGKRDFSREIEKRTCRIDGQLHTFHYARQQVRGYEAEVGQITADLETFAAEVRSAGGRYGVAFVPTKLRVLAPFCEFPEESDLLALDRHLGPLHAELTACGERSGIAVLDLTPPLQAAARAGRIPWFWGDTHWNDHGHEVASRALASWPPRRGARRLSLATG